ncbi:MAG TPA: hypothetical protein PKN85_07830 [Syntrophorhabdaceae bacterium]|nr:hypothetical protein [Syntrophorhabdaceae bacterium]
MDVKRCTVVAVLLAASILLSGCGKPVPPDKAAYVGEWQSREMYLSIAEDGSVKYKRMSGGVSKSLSAPLRGFEGDNFVVGLPFLSTTFIVARPPYEADGQRKMIVDGVTLTRFR